MASTRGSRVRARLLARAAYGIGSLGIVSGFVILGAFFQSLRSPVLIPQEKLQITAAPVLKVSAPSIEQRSWRDISGKFNTEATLTEAWNETVYLKRNEKTIAIPLAKLCLPDRDYVRRAFPVQKITGMVVALADGDTITVLDNSKTQHKVRLEGIDAPESGQAFGEVSSVNGA